MDKIALFFCLMFSIFVFGQKKELRKIEKKIDSKRIGEATAGLNKIKAKVKGTDYEGYYYYLSGKRFFAINQKKKYAESAKAFYKVLDLELENSRTEFSEKSIAYLNDIYNFYFKVANKALVEKRYNNAAGVYQKVFNIRPSRQEFLDLSHYSFVQAKNKENACRVAEKMLKLQGDKLYQAKNIYTKSINTFFTSAQRNQAIEQKTHTEPSEIEVDTNKRMNYYNSIIDFYNTGNNSKKLLSVLKKAKNEFPKNINYNEAYINTVYKTGDKQDYVEALEEFLAINPNNKTLFFNLGVVYKELNQTAKSLEAYDKAIALDSAYRAAHINKGIVLLSDENKLIDELNQNLRNKKKYDQIDKQIKQMYLNAIPSFRKAYDLEKDEKIKATLSSLYKTVGQSKKVQEL